MLCPVCWKQVVVSKDHSFENIKKRRQILGPFFPLVFEDQVIIDYLRRQKLDQARLRKPSRLMCLVNVHFWVFPKIGVPKWSFFSRKTPWLLGKPSIFGNIHWFFFLYWKWFMLSAMNSVIRVNRTWHHLPSWYSCFGFSGHPGENETTLSLQSCPTRFLNLAVLPALKMAWFIWAWLEVGLGLVTSL